MDKELEKFSIDVASFEIVPEEYSDSQLAVVEIYVCHDGNNRHNVPITREALVRAKDTLKNKFLVAGFDGNDFEGHEPDEQIVGFFPESSKMKFEKPNTVSVPILVSRLQAGAGLVNVGSIVDVYTNLNNTGEELNTNNTNPDISGCTVLSIMRYEENGEVDSEYSKSKMNVHGNITNPQENTKKFSSNVLEMIKGSIMNGYDEQETFEMLKNYGVKLSNYERQINLGDLDAQYMLLIETPQDKVNFMLNNMDNIVLTIPTTNAPEWMVNEISATYQ